MSDKVLVSRDGAIGTITLNRPEALNALDPETLNALVAAARELAEDESVRCVVITGNGRAFSAGGDVKGMADRQANGLVRDTGTLRDQEEVSRLLYEMPKPTIAAVNGVAAGAGMSIALAADYRVCSDQARFTTAFAKVAFSGDFGGTWLLQRLVGPAKAKELYFFSPMLSASDAQELGLVNKVVPHDSLAEETAAVAKRLANGPTLAFGRMKQNFAYGATNTFGDSLTLEAENMTASGKTEDHKGAALAFVEKREPAFQGR